LYHCDQLTVRLNKRFFGKGVRYQRETHRLGISWITGEFATQFLTPVETRVMPNMLFAGRWMMMFSRSSGVARTDLHACRNVVWSIM
jgi:hypothetical protein